MPAPRNTNRMWPRKELKTPAIVARTMSLLQQYRLHPWLRWVPAKVIALLQRCNSFDFERSAVRLTPGRIFMQSWITYAQRPFVLLGRS